MTETKGDVQHHIGYAYHKLNDRRLMWIQFLEEKIEACQQRIQDSGKRVARETQEETEALEPAITSTEVEPEREDETETTDLDTREEAVEASEEESTEELW